MDQKTRRAVAKQLLQAAAKLEAGDDTDYMALPTMIKAQEQIGDVVLWLQESESTGRRLEDWLEAKLTTLASDLDDVHTYVMHRPEAGVEGVEAVSAAGSFPFHKGLETEEHLRQGYLAAHSIKAALDAMEEVPNSLMPLYKQTMKTINSAKTAIDDAHQLRMMLLKLSR